MRRLKIVLVAPPYSGHLNPLLGLGRELLPLGEVTMITTPGAIPAAEASGLRGYPIMREGEALVNEIATPGQSVKGNPFLLFRQLKANVSLQGDMLAELEEAFAELRPDLVIADFTLPVAGVAAARCGARWWTNLPSPCVFETPDGPPAYFGGLSPAESPAGKMVHFSLRKLTRLFKRLMFFLFRRTFRKVGLTSVYRDDGSERVYSPEKILACSIPEIEFPRTYPPHFQFVGPSLFTPPMSSSSPDFISGKKHALVTLGSHLGHQKDAIGEGIRLLAREHPGWEFHFTDGDASSDRCGRDGNFRRYPFISYDLHLPRYDVVIHHGGSGVLLHCLKHGIPSVVIPIDFDQFDNAARLAEAGVACRVSKIGGIGRGFSEVTGSPLVAAECRRFAAIVAGYDYGEVVRLEIRRAFGL